MLRDLDILNIDYSAANSAYRITETHKVSDLNGKILIPYEGPMFARNLVIRGDGSPLSLGKDYTLEDEFIELEKMTGKRVIGSLRFSSNILTDYKELMVTYQKVGEVVISRELLVNSIEHILNDDKPIDWLTQVFGKPDTYPPAYHYHDITDESEIVGYHDLVFLFKMSIGDIKTEGFELWNNLKAIEQKAFKTLNDTYTVLWDKMFSHIMNMNVPHPMTKADIGLSDHPDYETATIAEDRAAGLYEYDETTGEGDNEKLRLRTDAISTPLGLRNAIENHDIDTSGFIRQGSLPFSYYGSGFYIPPPISGSFEGLGTNTGGNALCMESNGWTVLLTRGFDSKVRRLYYYYNKNIYDTSENFVFSGYTYYSQTMENNGDEPNHILSGSSGRIIVVGDKTTDQYYIALGNGTLDANSHQLKKIDMSVFKVPEFKNSIWNSDKAYVMLTGDFIYIIAQYDDWAPTIPDSERFGTAGYRTICFFRAEVKDLNNPSIKELIFSRQEMTYENTEGDILSKQKFVNICKNVIELDSEGNKILKRCVFNFSTPPTSARLGSPWRCQWFNMENPNDKTDIAIRMFHNVRWEYVGKSRRAGDWYFCIPMRLDTKDNSLRIEEEFFKITRDPSGEEPTIVPEGFQLKSWYSDKISSYITGHSEEAAAFIPKLGYVACRTNVTLLPYAVVIGYNGLNPYAKDYQEGKSDWDVFNQDLSLLESNGFQSRNIPLEAPFGFTTKPMFQRDLWEYDGKVQSLPIELFSALNKTGSKCVWYRETEGSYDYAQRDAYKFKYIAKDIIGRVPSTKFGEVYFGDYKHTLGARVAVVNTSFKNKYGVQYGIVNTMARNYAESSDAQTAYSGLYGSDDPTVAGKDTVNKTFSSGDLHVTLLGTHTVDRETNKIYVEKNIKDTVILKRAEWVGLIKKMLGSRFNQICSEKGGYGTDGEWVITIYISAQEGNANNVIPSVALLYWHTFSEPNKTYGIYATFNWKTISTESNGERVIQLTNVTFPDEQYGPNTTKVIYPSYSYDNKGLWSTDSGYAGEATVPEVQIDFTDKNNYYLWMTSGITMTVPLNSAGVRLRLKMTEGKPEVSEVNVSAMYNAGGYINHYLYVTDLGMTIPVSMNDSGGAALYVKGGNIPNGTYAILQAVFIEGNWTLFVSSDLTAIFNGSEKTIGKVNYDLTKLGVNYKNKTFYLYAISGKVKGYYDLSLSERTASPYHLLVAVITTNSFGIEEIDIQQRFAISGFTITTANKGGSIPATVGTFPETGEFDAIVKEDIFDTSQYK